MAASQGGPLTPRHVGVAVLAALLTLPGSAAGQAPPPDGDWRTLRTEHFRVTFPPALEPLAREAAGVAERAHAVLREELAPAPGGTIDLIVSDHVDFSNGYASVFSSNRIVVYARPPTAAPQLAYVRDWLEMVVTHELVHVFHLNRTGGLGRLVRGVFGRVPSVWPIFPVVGSPGWSVEGLATHYESRLTGAGRIPASVHDMIIRTAALEDRIPPLDELSTPSPVWPAGQRDYVFGSRLMHYIAETYGPGAHRRILEETAGSLLPTFLFFDHVARDAVGEPFDVLYDRWRGLARDSARAVLRRVEAAGRTRPETVYGTGPYASAPRVSPGGDRLSFAAYDYRSDPATLLLDLDAGRTRRLARRNQSGTLLGPASWAPDGQGVVVAQLELDGPYRAYSDLWWVDLHGGERRLTRGARLAQPDVGPDGRVAATQSHGGAIRLAVFDPGPDRVRVVAGAAPGDAFDSPRWNPAGDRIAAGRFAGGQVDLVLVDPVSGDVNTVTDDAALDLAPAWSPDGRWLLWWSDRTGVPNLMAVRVREGRPVGAVRQVTNVATGAFDPEVAPDGGSIYFAGYHHDGWHIERIPFDPASWRPAPAPMMAYGPALLPEPGEVADEVAEEVAAEEPTPYSALPTVRPYFWLPTFETVGGGEGALRFLGAFTAGGDVLRRHEWSGAAAVDVSTGRVDGEAVYTYRGWASPELSFRASRDWGATGAALALADGGLEPILLRTDEAAVSALLWRPRWRSTGWLRATADVEAREYQPRDRSAEPGDPDAALPAVPTVGGVELSPGWRTARWHPFSISAQDGVSAAVAAGRWWVLDGGAHAYDQVSGRAAGYLGLPLGGFADHVLAVRAAGFVRDGDRARLRAIGGTPGSATNLLFTTAGGGPSYPVRGYEDGIRLGTRGWSMNAEYRFPLHLRGAPGQLLGLSLTSVSGAVFADAGDAWCTATDLDRFQVDLCDTGGAATLVSAGGELSVDLGIFHQQPARVRLGVAARLAGAGHGARVYVSLGPAF